MQDKSKKLHLLRVCLNYNYTVSKTSEIAKIVQERKLMWYVMRNEEHYVGRRAVLKEVQGKRKIRRRKKIWLDEMIYKELYDRATWRRISSNINST